ncbi:hypothetical protein RRG08_066050 [Elysia crispata]|uniref:Uncharacterized protein n=1 Tax=Elysia crispata TaxID=231223 RepID=A0AAE0Y2R5_9GAST|nr:hypothetical protein RRG08_066050 [Elysia crispata]
MGRPQTTTPQVDGQTTNHHATRRWALIFDENVSYQPQILGYYTLKPGIGKHHDVPVHCLNSASPVYLTAADCTCSLQCEVCPSRKTSRTIAGATCMFIAPCSDRG